MIVKQLIQHGNSKAIVIDKAILQAAGLDENALFVVTVDPQTGITVQSVKPMNEHLFKNSLDKVLNKHGKLFKKLANR